MRTMKGTWLRRGALLATGACVAAVAVTGTAYATLPGKPAQTWGTNGRIDTILPVGDQVFVGGSFTAVVDPSGKTYPASNIAVISASSGAVDLSWQGAANKQVTSLAAVGSKLYVGGYFSKMDGQSRDKLAALDLATGAVDPNWKPATSAPVDAMGAANGSIYVSGLFTTVTDSAGVHNRAYAAKLDATTGALDTNWTPSPNDRTRALLVSADGTKVYLGGDFTSVNGLGSTNRVAAVSATGTGSVITTFKSAANNGTSTAPVFDLATDGTNVYEAVAGSGGACTAVNGSTGTRIWSKHANGNLQSVRYSSGVVYCGGHFSGTGSFDAQTRYKLAAVSATSPYATTSFAPKINSALGVWALGSDPSHLFVGGDFTKVAGVATQHYAEFVDSAAQTVPSAPTLSASAGNNVVHLSWTPPASDGGSPILRYAVYRKLASATSYGSPIAKVSSGTTYDDSTAVNGTSYTYEVAAVNAIGTGAMSNEVSATPQSGTTTAPAAPTGLTATPASGSIQLSWSAPASDGGSPITGYRIYRGTASGAETSLATVTGTGTAYTDTAVTNGTTYYYTVAATNAVGAGPASNEASATAGASVPGAPTLTGTAATGVVHLSWTPPASDGGSPITKYIVARDGVRLVTLSGSTLSFDDTTVTSGTQYTYQVRAQNVIGNGPYSNKLVITAQ